MGIPITKMPDAAVNTFLFLLLLLTTAQSAPILGLDSFLNQQFRADPSAFNDSFTSLPSSVRRSLSSPSLPLLSRSLVSSFLSHSLSLSIHVRLVGPDFPPSAASTLASFLSSTVSADHFNVISPDSLIHTLAVSHSLQLDASVAPFSLSTRIDETLKTLIAGSISSLRTPLLSLPYGPIDELIHHEFQKENHDNGVYIYLLSLGSRSRPYAYSYSHGDSSAGFTKCLGSIWTGRERYLWIDLSAGPVDYGPGLSGDGVIPRGEFHPLAALHGSPKSQKALVADLASLVYSAYQVLVVPSLRIPVYFENSLVVQLIHVHETDDKDPHGLDWDTIKRTFTDEVRDNGLLLGDQTLDFKSFSVNYKECAICSFAISRAITSYTSRFLFDNYTLIVSEYLDSKSLHHTLSKSADEFNRVLGIPEEDYGHVLPVYVFDLDFQTQLLLDRYHQSVAFRDMVIAVRTKSTQTVSDYMCNGRHVFLHTRELERPIVGSILQSMWGVSPTHLSWSPRHNTTLVDYTWSVGHTPFGPFSELSSLSFVQRDAARRNVLLTSLNYSITSAIEVVDSVEAHGGDRNLLKQGVHTEFVQRSNLFKYKLEKSVSALSHFDFGMALFYLRSSDHDLYAMHSIVYHATQEIEASLNCFKDPPFPWGQVSITAVGLFVLFYVYAKRETLFRSKRKQF